MAASIFDQGPDLRTIRANTATLNEIVSSVLSLRAQSQLDQAKATAAEAQAQGSQAEAGAYTTSATIAEQNAFLAEASGKIQQYQQLRSAFQTIGAQKAAVAAAGFASSGSSLDLLRSSTQQAYLQNQILGINAASAQSGYLGQAAASRAEATAATAASTAQLALAQQARQASEIAQAQATNEANALKSVFPSTPQSAMASEAAGGGPIDTSNFAKALSIQTGVGGGMVYTGNGWVPVGTINWHTGKPY